MEVPKSVISCLLAVDDLLAMLPRLYAKRDRIQARHEDLFRSLEPGERAQAARLLERLAAAIEGLR